MSQVIAGCGVGVSQSCSNYATSGWSGGGVLFGLAALLIVILAAMIFRGRRDRGE